MGLTEIGEQQTELVIPSEMDGIPVKGMGYREDGGFSWAEKFAEIESEQKTETIKGKTYTYDFATLDLSEKRQNAFVSAMRPVKELKGYEKVFLNAGEEKRFCLEIIEETLKFTRTSGSTQRKRVCSSCTSAAIPATI